VEIAAIGDDAGKDLVDFVPDLVSDHVSSFIGDWTLYARG
jgi:hypothetical protein